MNPFHFTQKLLTWHATHHRPMPWKGERDPYKIWLSEIMLQQTRVEQGLPYFLKFVEKFPTVADLAAAPIDEVLKLWQGLGYYARARNLHETARHVAEKLAGKFPENFADLQKLKGVGNYTAAAIASFAFDLPHAVLDGNVFRVLSRVEGIETPIDSTEGKKQFAALANSLIQNAPPAKFNQAIMDFGATQCLPQNPNCPACPMADGCAAHLYNMVSKLPVKTKAAAKKRRHFLYFDFRAGEKTFIRQRSEKDIWQGLYEFPKIELAEFSDDFSNISELVAEHFFSKNFPFFEVEKISQPFRQLLTHREIVAVFIRISIKKQSDGTFDAPVFSDGEIEIKQIDLKKIYPLPKIIDTYLMDNALLLGL